uniref:Uncharacterized protein n=1 Tax=Tetraselmis sp. GSL018 TaxID=582737 RepID=A0A061QXN9_9CHLO
MRVISSSRHLLTHPRCTPSLSPQHGSVVWTAWKPPGWRIVFVTGLLRLRDWLVLWAAGRASEPDVPSAAHWLPPGPKDSAGVAPAVVLCLIAGRIRPARGGMSPRRGSGRSEPVHDRHRKDEPRSASRGDPRGFWLWAKWSDLLRQQQEPLCLKRSASTSLLGETEGLSGKGAPGRVT